MKTLILSGQTRGAFLFAIAAALIPPPRLVQYKRLLQPSEEQQVPH